MRTEPTIMIRMQRPTADLAKKVLYYVVIVASFACVAAMFFSLRASFDQALEQIIGMR